MVLKRIKPSSSYDLSLPEDICEQSDERVSSFWMDGSPIPLQVSSYIRTEGDQVSAGKRLKDRMSKTPGTWQIIQRRLHPDPTTDQAIGESLDEDGVLWVHSYIVWPHLTIYLTISGPRSDLEHYTGWPFVAVSTIQITVQ